MYPKISAKIYCFLMDLQGDYIPAGLSRDAAWAVGWVQVWPTCYHIPLEPMALQSRSFS